MNVEFNECLIYAGPVHPCIGQLSFFLSFLLSFLSMGESEF